MDSLKTIRVLSAAFFVATAFASYAEEPVCHHCEEIREYNAKYHENYEYYEDYLSSQKGGKATDTKVNGSDESSKKPRANSAAPSNNNRK